MRGISGAQWSRYVAAPGAQTFATVHSHRTAEKSVTRATGTRIYSNFVARLLAGLALISSTLLQAAPQNGWWWNPAESGRGFFLEVQGPRMFMAGYFYAEDGSPPWVVSKDPLPGPDPHRAPPLARRGGASPLGADRPPAGAPPAGAGRP